MLDSQASSSEGAFLFLELLVYSEYMEIICCFCQGSFEVRYKEIYRIEEEYYVTFCPGCDVQNEVWDVEEWFEPSEIEYIEKYNNNSEEDYADEDFA